MFVNLKKGTKIFAVFRDLFCLNQQWETATLAIRPHAV